MTAISHSTAMTGRHMRALMRQPWMVAMTLVQPLVWLLLFGALFERVTALPAFETDSYIDFLTPGIAVMSAILAGGWLGVGAIEDIKRGVLDRFLVAPTSRVALNVGRIAQQAIITLVQSAIILAVGFALGARYPGGVLGMAVLVLATVLLATAVGALSIALGLVTGRDESLIIATQLLLLPLTFVSTIFMVRELMPSWMQTLATLNPVDWAVVAGREALGSGTDWSLVWTHTGLLVAFLVVSVALATAAFRSYQRSQ